MLSLTTEFRFRIAGLTLRPSNKASEREKYPGGACFTRPVSLNAHLIIPIDYIHVSARPDAFPENTRPL